MESNRPPISIKQMYKTKRFRSAFTTEQINYLELQFKKYPYISSEHRTEIANALKLQERAIKIWFQNRRMKEKKEILTKECDGEINNVEQFGEDRLHNTPPSANEQLSRSLPMLLKTAANIQTMSGNTILDSAVSIQKDNNKPFKMNPHLVQHKQLTNQVQHVSANHDLSIKKSPTARLQTTDKLNNEKMQFKNNIPCPKSKKVTTCLTDLYRKTKKEITHLANIDSKSKIRKLESGHLPSAAKLRTAPVDLSAKKKRPAQIPPRPPKQANIGEPYYPVMSTVYAHPFMSSGGMILKPVNVLPVISPGSAMNIQSSPQATCCSCNCHGNNQSFTLPSGPINPYTQYVITSPFQNQSPKF